MSYEGFMKQATDIVAERGKNYGEIAAFLAKQVQLFEAVTGIRLTEREAALFMHTWKMTRIFEDPQNADHYVDGVNYLAFAGMMNAAANANVPQPEPVKYPAPNFGSIIKPLDLASRLGQNAVAGATDTGV